MNKNTEPKIKQYWTKVVCECVGHPAVHNKEGRVMCRKTAEVDLYDLSSRNELTTKLEEKSWKRLKTLGHFQYVCPTCATKIKDMRQKMKFRWG